MLKISRLPLLIGLLMLAACLPVNGGDSSSGTPAPPLTQPLPGAVTLTPFQPSGLVPANPPAAYGAHGSWIEVYFTDPHNPLSAQETGGVDSILVAAIDAARLSVDVAIYNLTINSMRDALIRAYQRGVQVRVVMESDNRDKDDPEMLMEAGITVLGDRREGLMHNKFVVIDRSEVWLGSMNFTNTGVYSDNNNWLLIRSVKMAENYTKEFDEMFVDDKFGPDVLPATPNPVLTIDGTVVETYFSPDDSVALSLLPLLENAQESIYFMAYSFTSDPLGEVIRARAAAGVTVAGVMDAEQIKSNIGTEYDLFQQAGLDVRPDGNAGLLHHKVMIIDEEIVITGSYNFTNSAETRNDENLVIIYNDQVADFFLQEFQRVFAQAQP
ncbi:MAG: phospholipase D-like domain-containing protein [Chloroflexota bacterium]